MVNTKEDSVMPDLSLIHLKYNQCCVHKQGSGACGPATCGDKATLQEQLVSRAPSYPFHNINMQRYALLQARSEPDK